MVINLSADKDNTLFLIHKIKKGKFYNSPSFLLVLFERYTYPIFLKKCNYIKDDKLDIDKKYLSLQDEYDRLLKDKTSSITEIEKETKGNLNIDGNLVLNGDLTVAGTNLIQNTETKGKENE